MMTEELTANLSALLDLSNSAASAPLSRIWLNGPGDLCGVCPMRPECPDQSRCLHLTASAGLTRRIDGPFRRFPLGARKVGEVALTRMPCVVRESLAATALAEPAWLLTHRIRSFAAVPIVSGERCLGVLALFSQRELEAADVARLEGATRCAAALVAGARDRASRAIVRPGVEPVASADPTGDPGAPEAPAARELRTLAVIEREAIERVLAHTGGRVSGPRGAAKILGLKPTTLESRMKKLGARKPPPPPRPRGR